MSSVGNIISFLFKDEFEKSAAGIPIDAVEYDKYGEKRRGAWVFTLEKEPSPKTTEGPVTKKDLGPTMEYTTPSKPVTEGPVTKKDLGPTMEYTTPSKPVYTKDESVPKISTHPVEEPIKKYETEGEKEPYVSKIDTPKEGGTGGKTPKRKKTPISRRKKVKEMSELEEELKKQVEKGMGAIREEMQRKLTPEEEVLYRGYTTNKVAIGNTKTTQKELEALKKVCRDITTLITDIDNDLPKLDNLENKYIGDKTGFFHAQSEAGYEFNILGLGQQYKSNMEKAKLAENEANKLLKELESRKEFITNEKKRFEEGKNKYKEDATTYKSEKKRTEKDKLGQYLNTWLAGRQDKAQEFLIQYQRLDSLFSATMKSLENGISYASGVKIRAEGLKKNASDKIKRIDNYLGSQAPKAAE